MKALIMSTENPPNSAGGRAREDYFPLTLPDNFTAGDLLDAFVKTSLEVERRTRIIQLWKRQSEWQGRVLAMFLVFLLVQTFTIWKLL